MGCCSSLFSLQTSNGKVVDVTDSFSSRSWPVRIFKFLCLSATITAIVLFLRLLFEHDADEEKVQFVFEYMAYFTVWGLVCSALYFITSWVNSCIPLRQNDDDITKASWRTKWTWGVFEVAAHTELMVTLLYWTLVHDSRDMPFWDAGNLLAHGGVMVLVLISGLVVNRVPVRLLHFVFPFAVDFIYLLWTFVHDKYELVEADEDDQIYDVIDWNEEFRSTAVLSIVLLFLVSPLVWLVLWLASLCGRKTIEVSYGSHQSDYQSVAHANENVGRRRWRGRRQ